MYIHCTRKKVKRLNPKIISQKYVYTRVLCGTDTFCYTSISLIFWINLDSTVCSLVLSQARLSCEVFKKLKLLAI